MVSGKADQRKAVKSKKAKKRVGLALLLVMLGILVAAMVVGIGFLVKYVLDKRTEPEVEAPVVEVAPDEPEVEVEPLPDKVDFQPVVDDWAAKAGGNRSVLIYDLERDEVVGKYNETESYNTASLYKLFVVYEGYRRVQSGEWKADDMAGTTGYTIEKCLDLAIRESYSSCAETLWGYIGHDALDEIIENDFKITNSDISTLTSNPGDIMLVMKLFYEHPDITDENLLTLMKDSFLNQPVTTYNWRQGLPSGFNQANVYNKVGWDYNPNGGYWNIYHDAAIVEFPEQNRHFIVVAMTNRVPFQRIKELGTAIENKFLVSTEEL